MNLSTLKKLRHERKLTQADMGMIIGVSRSAYTNKESGIRKFSPEEMHAVAILFNCSIEEIFFDNKVTKCV
ncbi:MAG: helix-turn-helix domain-containing protein [Turicibacter sp.]|nr:helix-turn-helix domain-containing protein [Turicibacter sp.]